MSTKIQLRRGTATQWTTANPVLAAGEVGYETDTGNIKVGTGTAGSGAWNNLPYYQLPRVSVVPATSSNLNAANYLVQGIYRLATNNNSGVTWTGTPSDFHSANTAESTLTVTIHQYTGQTTLTQQVLTQRTTTTGSVKQWVRLWDGTTLTAWTSTSHLSDSEVTTATIANATSTTDGVTDAKLRWSAAGSVIGRSAATAGAPADIVAGTDGHVLRRAGTDIGFGTIVSAGIASDAVIAAKIAANAVTYAKLATDILQVLVPIGSVLPYAGSSAPSSQWLICNGSAVSRTTYSALFGVLSTTFGSGDGSTTFNLPDLRGRTAVGVNTAAYLTTLGATAGSADAIVVSHNHTATSTSTVTDPGHTHTFARFEVGNVTAGANTAGNKQDVNRTTSSSTTGITVATSTTVNSTGSSGTNANLPPSIALNFIIRAL
jgi:microcystin-dependent protein